MGILAAITVASISITHLCWALAQVYAHPSTRALCQIPTALDVHRTLLRLAINLNVTCLHRAHKPSEECRGDLRIHLRPPPGMQSYL